jgi:hypothetical protein
MRERNPVGKNPSPATVRFKKKKGLEGKIQWGWESYKRHEKKGGSRSSVVYDDKKVKRKKHVEI